MSSILEALKKLDRERTERRGANVNIEREILKPSISGGARNKSRFFVFLLAFAVLLAVPLVMVFFWWGPSGDRGNFKENVKVRQKVASPNASRTGRLPMPESVAQVPASAVKKEAPPGPGENKGVSPMARPGLETAPVPSTRAAVKPGPVVAAPADKTAPATLPAVAAPAPPPRKKTQEVSARRPSLSVAGVAYGQSRKSRFAIINGQPVSIGEVVDGAKVEDISEEAVHFSWQGRKFNLGVGESTRP